MNKTFENSRIKRSKFSQEYYIAGNNQFESWNQQNRNEENNTKSQWDKEEIKGEIKDFLKFNENDHTTYPNLWDTMNAVLRGQFITLNAYIKKLEISHTSELGEYLKTLEQIIKLTKKN